MVTLPEVSDRGRQLYNIYVLLLSPAITTPRFVGIVMTKCSLDKLCHLFRIPQKEPSPVVRVFALLRVARAHALRGFSHECLCPGRITSAVLNAVVAEELLGPGTVFLNVNWNFKAPVRPGDMITGEVGMTNSEAGQTDHGQCLTATCSTQ